VVLGLHVVAVVLPSVDHERLMVLSRNFWARTLRADQCSWPLGVLVTFKTAIVRVQKTFEVIFERLFEILFQKILVEVIVVAVAKPEQDFIRIALEVALVAMQDSGEREGSTREGTTTLEGVVEPPIKRLRVVLYLRWIICAQEIIRDLGQDPGVYDQAVPDPNKKL
jgi:hypothetical protein